MLEDERHFRPKSRQMICTMLCCIRLVFVDIWRVIQSVCFWPSWFKKATSSSTVVTFSSVRACFNLPLSCFCSVLPVIQIFLVMCPSLSLFLFILRNFASILCKLHFLTQKKFLFKALSPLLNARYFTSALSLDKKLFFYNNIIWFCLETQGMYQKLNIIRY